MSEQHRTDGMWGREIRTQAEAEKRQATTPPDFTEQALVCPTCGHSEISKSKCDVIVSGGILCDCDNEFHWWKPFEKEARDLVIRLATTLEWNKIDTATLIERIRLLVAEAATAALEQERKRVQQLIENFELTVNIGGYIRAMTPAELAAKLIAAIGDDKEQQQ